GIEPRRVDDVVAVRAAGARGQDRRAVEMRDAEACEICDDPARSGERKLACELETVGRAHHVRCDARSKRGPGSEKPARCRDPRLAPETVSGWRSRSRRPGPRSMPYTPRANRVPRRGALVTAMVARRSADFCTKQGYDERHEFPGAGRSRGDLRGTRLA